MGHGWALSHGMSKEENNQFLKEKKKTSSVLILLPLAHVFLSTVISIYPNLLIFGQWKLMRLVSTQLDRELFFNSEGHRRRRAIKLIGPQIKFMISPNTHSLTGVY